MSSVNEIANILRIKCRESGLIKNRDWQWSHYEASFLGSEMVDWLISQCHLTKRAEAIGLANELFRQGVFIKLTGLETDFVDGNQLYRFIEDDRNISNKFTTNPATSTWPALPKQPTENKKLAASSVPWLDLEMDAVQQQDPVGAQLSSNIPLEETSFSSDRINEVEKQQTAHKKPPLSERLGFHPQMRISIDRTETRIENNNRYTIYKVILRYGTRRWIVLKRYREFRALHSSVAHELPEIVLPKFPPRKLFGSMDPIFVNERRLHLESYLRTLVNLRNIWKSNELIGFFDSEDNSSNLLDVHLRLQRVVDIVAENERQSATFERDVSNQLATVSSDACKHTNELHKHVILLQQQLVQQQNVIKLLVSGALKTETDSDTNLETELEKLNVVMSNLASHPLQEAKFESHERSREYTVDAVEKGPPRENPREQSPVAYDLSPIIKPSSIALAAQHSLSKSLLNLIMPTRESNRHRDMVFQFMRCIIKKSLGAQCFLVGDVPTRTYLPDQELKLSVFLCSGETDRTWFVRVNKILCMASSGCLVDSTEGVKDFEMFLDLIGVPLADKPTILEQAKRVSQVSFINVPVSRRVKCVVDGVASDVTANELDSLCCSAFISELDTVIGQNHLLKRTLMLTYAWATYETKNGLAGEHLLATLPRQALVVMVIYTFHCHGSDIIEPFQALAWMLHEVEHFDWEMKALSIFGPVDISKLKAISDGEAGESLEGLLGDVENKTWDISIWKKYNEKIQQHRAKANSSSALVSHGHTSAKIPGSAFMTGMSGDNPDIRQPKWMQANEKSMLEMSKAVEDSYSSIREAAELYDAGAGPDVNTKIILNKFVILHPLNLSHNVCGFLSDRRVRRVRNIFKQIAMKVQDCLHSEPENMQDAFDDIFPVVIQRFQDNWRPDLPAEGASDLSLDSAVNQDPLYSDHTSQFNSVEYTSFLLDNAVTAPALLSLSQQILAEHGPLPVGEIGKLLQELTGNPSLSATLKEKFGGLKKFLEKYTDDFLIGLDHSFNPSVYLKKTLQPQQIHDILTGKSVDVGGAQKRKRSKNKKAKPQSAPSTSQQSILPSTPANPQAYHQQHQQQRYFHQQPNNMDFGSWFQPNVRGGY